MAINYAEKYSSVVDERFRTAAKSAAFVNNDYDFVDGSTVKVFSIPTSPMNDYMLTGTNRYGAPSELENTLQTMTLSQDRSFTFTIDKRSSSDTMGVMQAGAALSRQLDEVVLPEIDQYRFAKMALGAGNISTGELTNNNAYSAFITANAEMLDALVPLEGRCAVVTSSFLNKLKRDSEFIKGSDLGQGMITAGAIGLVDGISVFLVPTSYLPAGTEFMIVHPTATTAPQKLAEYKVHDNPPGINGQLVEGRIYHDAFVLNNKKDGIYLHQGSIGTLTVTAESAGSGKVSLIVTGQGQLLRAGAKLYYKAATSQAAATLGQDVSAWTQFNSGDELSLTSGHKCAVAIGIDAKAMLGGIVTV